MNDSETTVNIAHCPNPASGNRRLLDALLPEAFREEGLNLEAVKRSLREAFTIEGGERYRLEWAGKSDAHKNLQTSTTATLRPQRNSKPEREQPCGKHGFRRRAQAHEPRRVEM